MPNTFDLIKEKDDELRDLHIRQDKDEDTYNMLPYKLKDVKGQELKDVVNVTMNDPKVFADRAQAFMNEATMQTVVKGKHLKDADTTTIENFDADIRYEIDQQLLPTEIQSLFAFLIEQACIRGILGARYVALEDKNQFKPKLLPCDSRYLLWDYDAEDLGWGAFKTVRSKTAIEKEYRDAKVQGTKGAIWEFWDKKIGEIWLSDPLVLPNTKGDKIDEKENVFGYPPFIIQGVGAGSMLQGESSIGHKFESVFANNRLLYTDLNMLASILQTLNLMTFRGTYQWESEAGIEAIPPKEGVGTGKTFAVDKGTKGLFPVEINDVKNATRLLYALILGAIQRGSLPNIDYGNLTFPLSAVAISRLTATKDAIFAPRLQAIAWFYRKLHYMIKDQYIKGGYKTELGEEGLTREYSASDLDKKYTIRYKFFAVSPEQDIANYAVAQQAMAVGMSRHTVYTDILKLKNPDGEIMKSRAEMAEKVDPVIALRRYAHGLIDQGEFFEAELVKERIKIMLKQRYQPPTEGVPSEEESIAELANKGQASPQSLVPLLEGGGGRGRPAQDEFEAETIEPEETMRKEERRQEVVRKHEAEG